MKSIILSLSCAISLLASTTTFAQGTPGGPGQPGGGGTPSGLGYTINIVTIQGMDEVTAKHRDANGNIYSDHWTRDWLENGWRLNGASTSNGGLWVTGIAPTTPVANDGSINAPIEMTSQGTQKVTIQYNGDLQNMPSEIGIILTSTAKAYYQESGSASANNGLGNDSFYVGAGTDYSLLGLAGQYSDGKNLRIIKLNSSGYGELTFSSSAEAHSSGFGARVWANAQSASVVLDGRRVSLAGTIIPSVAYAVGQEGSFVNPIAFNIGTATVYEQFNLRYWDQKVITPQSTSFTSEEMSFPIGVPVRSLKEGVDFYPTYSNGDGMTIYYGSLVGTSSYPNGTTLYGQVPQAHLYQFDISQPNFNVLTDDSISGIIHFNSTTESRQYGHFYEGPYQTWTVVQDPYDPSHYYWGKQAYNSKDLNETHTLAFSVDYADGVKGLAEYRATLMPKGEHVDFSDIREIYHSSLPWRNFDAVNANTISPSGFVYAGSESCIFYITETDANYAIANFFLTLFRDSTCLIPSAEVEAVVNFALSGAEYMVELTHDQNGVITINRPSSSGADILEFVSGDLADFQTHPNSYEWIPVVQQPLLARVETAREYGTSGYLDTVYGTVTKEVPKSVSDYRKYKVRKYDPNW